jgi:hypothetical protein
MSITQPADIIDSGSPVAPAVRSDRAFAAVLTAVYLSMAVVKILRHVMWRDEWRAWMIARDSGTIAELLANLRHDGHPGLWYAILYALSRLTRDPVAMKLAHVVIAAAAVWMVARFAPLTRVQRVLFAFGYFAFFEYATISRSYGLGLLLVVAACTVFVRYGPRRVLALAILLVLLANTSVYGSMLAAALALAYVFARLRDLAPADEPPTTSWQEPLAAVVLWVGFLATFALMYPGPDPQMLEGTWFGVPPPQRIAQTLASVWRGYVPLPRAQVSFWNTNVLDGLTWAAAGLSLVIVVGIVAGLRDRRVALTFYLLGTAAILAATGFKFAGALRHHGHLFVVLLIAYWIDRSTRGPRRGIDQFMTVLLAVHAVAGVAVSVADAMIPFSASRAMAAYIRQEQFEQLPLIGHTDIAVSSVSGALDRPVYYLVERDFATFNTQDPRRRYPMFHGKMLQNIDRVVAEGGGEALLIATQPLDLPPDRFRLIATFDRSIVADERYELYHVNAGKTP